VDKISNEEVLAKVEEDRQIMKIIQQRQHHWIGHILKHDSLLLDIINVNVNVNVVYALKTKVRRERCRPV